MMNHVTIADQPGNSLVAPNQAAPGSTVNRTEQEHLPAF